MEVETITQLQLEKLAGTWYEITRLPFYLENGLVNIKSTVTFSGEQFSLVSEGYLGDMEGQKRQIKATAWVSEAGEAMFEVAFFGTFIGEYQLIAVDNENYAYCAVMAKTKKAFWIFGRQPQLDNATLQSLIQIAEKHGIETEYLLSVEQCWKT